MGCCLSKKTHIIQQSSDIQSGLNIPLINDTIKYSNPIQIDRSIKNKRYTI